MFDNGFGVVQFKPPGSGRSVQFGTNMTSAAPSSADGLYLIVSDVSAARNELVAWGADVSGVFHPEAAAAHGEHEGRTGETDPNWPEWYAAYMAAEQAGTELPS